MSCRVAKIFSAIDLTDEYYQILMRESNVPQLVISNPSGVLLG